MMDRSSNGSQGRTDAVLQQAEHMATAVKDGVMHAGTAVKDSVMHAGTAVKDGMVHAGESVSDKANSAVASVGDTMTDMASGIRRHTPAGVAPYTEKATAGLQHAGEYLQQGDIGGIIDDLSGVISRNPMASMAAGVAIGFLLARKVWR